MSTLRAAAICGQKATGRARRLQRRQSMVAPGNVEMRQRRRMEPRDAPVRRTLERIDPHEGMV